MKARRQDGLAVACGLTMLLAASATAQEGKGLITRWSERAGTEVAEYPRPTMVRPDWLSLDGTWTYAITAGDATTAPDGWDGRILVPFAVESTLSGVARAVSPDQRLWYRRTFNVPPAWRAGRLLLHFDAVDWETEVWIDGTRLGIHRGGYDRFTFDITEALAEDGPHELVVAVRDPTDSGGQPRGKQTLRPGGIWYTAVTGIWQPVWIEPVPDASIRQLRTVTDPAASTVTVDAHVAGAAAGDVVAVAISAGGAELATSRGPVGGPLPVRLERVRVWSPEDPFLYDLSVRLLRNGREIDSVRSYVGVRSVSIAPGPRGAVVHLNGEPLFQVGPLDQGWWPDGLYTAPVEEALRFDVEMMKLMGFNMVRKHVKIEPERWYAHCDQMGLLVWQDMPSGGASAPFVTDPAAPGSAREVRRGPGEAAQFETELAAMIEQRGHHPSVIMWVPFNEGWGQYDTQRITRLVKRLDPTRLVNPASGWNDLGGGDVLDVHRYPGPGMPRPEVDRAVVLGEFGGLGLPVPGHLWTDQGNWGYRSYTDREALAGAYEALYLRLHALVGEGLSAAVYTQLTDVELEVNGLLTYDRAELKIDYRRLRDVHARLAGTPPRIVELAPTSRDAPRPWRYTVEDPGAGWWAPSFDDREWSRGRGGFGTAETPGAVVGTTWDGPEIWIRRSVSLERVPDEPWLLIHHDEDARVYLNGRLASELRGYTTDYTLVRLDAEAASLLRPGENLIAIHCRQTGGGQFIDAGLVEVVYD